MGRFAMHSPEPGSAAPSPQERDRMVLRRKIVAATEEQIEEWLHLDAPRNWVLRHAPALAAAGLSATDAHALYRRLGEQVAQSLSPLLDAGRMADIDVRYVHLWAASGLLRAEVVATGRPGRTRKPSFTHWVTQARRYITACGGNQHLAAAAAAAGYNVAEAAAMAQRGDWDLEALETLAALRDAAPDL